MLLDPTTFEQTCAAIAKHIETTLREAFPDDHIGYVIVFKDVGPPASSSNFSLSCSNVRADKVEEIFTQTLKRTREVTPRKLESIIKNPFTFLNPK